jgi:hypothetical protein
MTTKQPTRAELVQAVLKAEASAVQALSKDWKVRASQASKLMTNGAGYFSEANQRDLEDLLEKQKKPKLTENQEALLRKLMDKRDERTITEKQLAELNRLKAKKAGPSLTPKQLQYLDALKAKKAAPFELSETAKTSVQDTFLRKVYGYDEPVYTREMLKGILCEQDSLGLVQKLVPSKAFRIKNTERLGNKYATGVPDVKALPEKVSEDVKTSWDIRTFFLVRNYPPEYYGQGQVYMDLEKTDRFRLHYCLVNTPEELIVEMEKKYFFKFGCDEDNKHYREACQKIRQNHLIEDVIPAELRLKTFEFERDEAYIKELYYRVKHAREYFASLRLNNV